MRLLPGSSRLQRSVRSDDNIRKVEDLVRSQEDKPKTDRSAHKISQETGIPQLSVHRIIHHDLQLKCFKRRRAKLLTEANRVARLTR